MGAPPDRAQRRSGPIPRQRRAYRTLCISETASRSRARCRSDIGHPTGKVGRLASLIRKVGALGFALALSRTCSINPQLLGGIWILQTFPAVVIGLYTRWFHRYALIIGWAVGMAYGTVRGLTDAGGRPGPLRFLCGSGSRARHLYRDHRSHSQRRRRVGERCAVPIRARWPPRGVTCAGQQGRP